VIFELKFHLFFSCPFCTNDFPVTESNSADLWASPIAYIAGPIASYLVPGCSGDVLSSSFCCLLGWSDTSLHFNFCWHNICCIPTSCYFSGFVRSFFTALFRLHITTCGRLTVQLHNFKRFSTNSFSWWMSLLSSHPPFSKGFALEGNWEYSSPYLPPSLTFAAIHLV